MNWPRRHPCRHPVLGHRRGGAAAYIGVDNRAAGRTSGFLMGRFCTGPGKLAVVWGGQLYRSHEEREIGFRTVLRQDYPALQIIEAVNGNDDPGLNFACVSELIARHPDLLGVYCVGGGQGAVAAAIESAGLAQKLVMIGHNFNDETKPYVLSGTIDAIIHQDMTRIADAALNCLIGVKGSPSAPASDRDHHAREPDAPLGFAPCTIRKNDSEWRNA
jgi:LacI family transcriptional regulator